jgi:CHAT domain-containing protein
LEEAAPFKQVNYRALKYLIKSHPIGYAYSTAMMHNKKTTLRRSPPILAVGFTGGQRLRAADPDLEEIAGAELELEALSKRFENGRFLVGKEATEANFKSLSPAFDIIHLAIHGKGDVEKNFSASLFFRTKYDSLDDGELHSYELYGLKLKAILAVLSACESGLGMGYKGEGMISMASAFTYSGCENILMSLWKVNDQASTVLMDEFYDQLMSGERIDDALRNAKLRYLENADELTSDPKIWASLVAYGSLDQVFDHGKYSIYFFGGVGVVVLIALYLLARKYLL